MADFLDFNDTTVESSQQTYEKTKIPKKGEAPNKPPGDKSPRFSFVYILIGLLLCYLWADFKYKIYLFAKEEKILSQKITYSTIDTVNKVLLSIDSIFKVDLREDDLTTVGELKNRFNEIVDIWELSATRRACSNGHKDACRLLSVLDPKVIEDRWKHGLGKNLTFDEVFRRGDISIDLFSVMKKLGVKDLDGANGISYKGFVRMPERVIGTDIINQIQDILQKHGFSTKKWKTEKNNYRKKRPK